MLWICIGGPQDHSRVWHFAGGTHKTQHIVASQLWFITVKGCEAKSGNQKGTKVKSADTRLELPRTLRAVSQVGLTSPRCVVTVRMGCSPEKLGGTQWGVFYWELATCAVSAWHLPKCQTHRRKAFVQHEPHCLCGQFRHREPLWSVLELLGRGNPFQGLRQASGLMLRNGLSKEIQSKWLYWPRDYREGVPRWGAAGKGPQDCSALWLCLRLCGDEATFWVTSGHSDSESLLMAHAPLSQDDFWGEGFWR